MKVHATKIEENWTSHYVQLTQALIFAESSRILDKGRALEIFDQVLKVKGFRAWFCLYWP